MLGFILIISILFFQSDDGCKKVKKPRPVKTWMNVVLAETYNVKLLQGRVVDSADNPISDVVIEIIKIPENGVGRRVAICQTQENGKFQFKNLKEGKYEVRCSKEGYDRTSVMVMVSKGKLSAIPQEIIIPMKVGN